MAEIEHFCDPRDKSHPKFVEIRDTVMKLYSACNQMDGKSAESMTIGEAVDKVFIIFLVKKPNILVKLLKSYSSVPHSFSDALMHILIKLRIFFP